MPGSGHDGRERARPLRRLAARTEPRMDAKTTFHPPARKADFKESADAPISNHAL